MLNPDKVTGLILINLEPQAVPWASSTRLSAKVNYYSLELFLQNTEHVAVANCPCTRHTSPTSLNMRLVIYRLLVGKWEAVKMASPH